MHRVCLSDTASFFLSFFIPFFFLPPHLFNTQAPAPALMELLFTITLILQKRIKLTYIFVFRFSSVVLDRCLPRLAFS